MQNIYIFFMYKYMFSFGNDRWISRYKISNKFFWKIEIIFFSVYMHGLCKENLEVLYPWIVYKLISLCFVLLLFCADLVPMDALYHNT